MGRKSKVTVRVVDTTLILIAYLCLTELGSIISCGGILDFYAGIFYKLSFYCFTLVTNKLYFKSVIYNGFIYIYLE